MHAGKRGNVMPGFKKGFDERRNVKGRPSKDRALTQILQRSLAVTEHVDGDKKLARKRILADLITQAVTTGKVTFPNGGGTLVATFDDWTALARWIFTHIDGPARQEIDLTTRQAEPFTADELAQAAAELNEWQNQTGESSG